MEGGFFRVYGFAILFSGFLIRVEDLYRGRRQIIFYFDLSYILTLCLDLIISYFYLS